MPDQSAAILLTLKLISSYTYLLFTKIYTKKLHSMQNKLYNYKLQLINKLR